MNKTFQLKLTFPEQIYRALAREAELTGITMADVIRIAVADRYRDQLPGYEKLEKTAVIPAIMVSQES